MHDSSVARITGARSFALTQHVYQNQQPGQVIPFPYNPMWQPLSSDRVQFGKTKPKKAPSPGEEDALFRLDSDYLRRFFRAAGWGGYNETTHGDIPTALGRFLMDVIAPWFKEGKPAKSIVAPYEAVLATRDIDGHKVDTTVKTLMGAESIFYQWIESLKKAQSYVQIALYDFDNIKVEGGAAPDGAQSQLAWHLQQEILGLMEKRAKEGVKFQVLLDNSVEYVYDPNGRPITPRPRNNQAMVTYLREMNQRVRAEKNLDYDPIDVVPYPKPLANIYHVKLMVIDGKEALVSGMNLSNHSAANWDMGVYLKGPEVANIQAETFYQDWIVAKFWDTNFTQRQWPLKQIFKYLPTIPGNANEQQALQSIYASMPAIKPLTPEEKPAIKILNTMPREYQYLLGGLATLAPDGNAQGFGRNQIESYFQTTLKRDDLASMDAEQFVACHKDLGQQLINLAQVKKVPIKIVHSNSVTSKFPYTRQVVDQLGQAELLKYYPEYKTIKERLHAKLTVFGFKVGKKTTYETVIGSANTSEAAFKTLNEGQSRRGNRDLAIVIPSTDIGKKFVEQINIDWNYSLRRRPSGYGLVELANRLNTSMPKPNADTVSPDTVIEESGLPLEFLPNAKA